MQTKRLIVLCSVIAVYLLSQAAQIAVTPIGEGMDFYGHFGYIVFFAERGYVPRPDEISMPAWIVELQHLLPAPDPRFSGRRFRGWAQLDLSEQEQIKAAMRAVPTSSDYVTPNYQTQHPPLYYWVMSRVYRRLSPDLSLDKRVYALNLASVCLTALALPAVYLTLRLYSDETTSLLALLAVAWYPNLLSFLARLTNDTLAFPLIAWGVYCCLRARASRYSVVAALLLTLAGFAKTYALTLWPVYLACAAAGASGINWRRFGIAMALTLAGAGSLLAFNYATTGHLIVLFQMRMTESISVAERLRTVLTIDPVWFFGGLVKGFWWAGYRSFVSPGVFYYAPLVLAAYPLFRSPRRVESEHRLFSIATLWPHYLAFASFLAGMAWHAATFKLFKSLIGQAIYSGNEGWYANVLIGSIFVIGVVLLRARLSSSALRRVLASTGAFFVVWNLLARVALYTFWTGWVQVDGRLRGIRWDQALMAIFNSAAWQSWLSTPGVIHPILLTSVLPLMMAITITAGALVWLSGVAPAEPSAYASTAAPATPAAC